ncbi:MAG: heparan-alpha-glucosaminide N-acetyltransferase domain-containing protein [Acidobacteriota bacterium]|nr:heparan-alpha-glucosaminide N-acetyltransferase domain-containing protein [Acidobacteriota bacterium]
MSETIEKIYPRIDSIDFLRGLVMVIMLIDHTREYVHAEAFHSTPTDLTKTNVALFFTRWITHICAPTFVFLAGTSVYLQKIRGKSPAQLSKFLLTRGLWLIVLEFTVVRFSLFFNFDYSFFGLAEVIWIFGVSMIVLAALIYLPVRVIAAFGIGTIALHNLLDGFAVPPATSMAGTPAPNFLQSLWLFLHQPGFVPLSENVKLFVAYPLLPWVGVMAAGYALGVVYTWETERRRKFLFKLGLALTALFVVIRATNFYGDPQIWTAQPSPVFTILSFLNTTKYPASLLFLLMTLGPALMILARADKINEQSENNFLSRLFITFGRVPLFYFILQMFVAHVFGVLLGLLAGRSVGFYFLNFPASSSDAPPDAGFPLWVVYAAWLAGLILLYPLCRWYGKIKQGKRDFPFSYL